MRAIFCGNFEFDARQSELERLFRKYGKVDRVDMKSGFAFVYMEDERDAEDAIRALDRFEFGRKGRRLRVEWTKQERGSSRRVETARKPASNSRPSKTLFVINFDPYHTRTRDLERHFDPYGKILNIRIRKNFAFIQYELQEDATKALDATNLSKLMDRVISVEYAMKDDDDKKPSYGMDRERDRSPRRGYGGHGRSPSPHARERGSPDYGHGHGRGRRSPSPFGRERASPDYGHRPRVHSISPTGKGRNSDYGRERSPIPRKERESRHSRDLSASPRRERNGNGRGLSPPRKGSPAYPIPAEEKDALSPGEYRRSSRIPVEEKDDLSPGEYRRSSRIPVEDKDDLSPGEYRRSRIPAEEKGALSPGEYRRSRIPAEEKDVLSPGEYRRSRIPAEEKDVLSPGEYRRSRIPAEEKDALSPGEYRHSRIPAEEKDALSPGEYRRSRSPDDRYTGEESPPPKRSMSRSPPARERSRS